MRYKTQTAIDALKDYRETVGKDIEKIEGELKPKETLASRVEELEKRHKAYLDDYEAFTEQQGDDEDRIANIESLHVLIAACSNLKRATEGINATRFEKNESWEERNAKARLHGLQVRAQHIQAVITSLEGAEDEHISTAELDRLGFFKIIRF